MKSILALTVVIFLSQQRVSLGCSGCAKSKSANMANNIQSTLGTQSNGLSGAKIIAPPSNGQNKQFDPNFFKSIGAPQEETNPNWSSSIQ